MALKPRKNGISEIHSKLTHGEPAAVNEYVSMREKEWYCKRLRALHRCHHKSGSAIAPTQYLKMTPIIRNMHITGKEKISAANRVHEVLAVGGTASDGG